MSSLSLAFTTVCPLLLLMALGALLRRAGLFSDGFIEKLNALCFKVFLPAVLFQSVYSSDFLVAFQPKLLVFGLAGVLITFAVLSAVVPCFEQRKDRRAVLIQGGFRSNIVLFGLPISYALFGADQVGPVSVLIAFAVPLFNILAVLTFEMHREAKVSVGSVIRGIVVNPLVIAGAAGILCALIGVQFPVVIETTVLQVAQVATPLALIALGGSFSIGDAQKNWRVLSCIVAVRLIIVPVVFLALAVVLGFRGPALGALLALFASPVAVSSYPMAQELGGDDELAGQIVALG
ncbi:MAG: AEC family transporter, partial [Raoultibacter sp.]